MKTTQAFIENEVTEQETGDYGLSDARISELTELLERRDRKALRKELEELSPADIASYIQKVDNETAFEFIDIHKEDIPDEAFAYLDREAVRALFVPMGVNDIASVVNGLDTDDAIDLLEFLEEDQRRDVLRLVSRRNRALVEEGLTYPEDSVGRLMERNFIAVPQFWTVGKTLDYVRGLKDDLPPDLYDLFIVDPSHQVVGELPLVSLMRAERKEKIADLMKEIALTLPAETDQEDAAYMIRRAAAVTAPVVDADQRLIGVITQDDIIDVIQEEAEEDILRLAGVTGETDLGRSTWGTARSRFTWLAVNLLTAIIASVAIAMFEATLDQIVALAILMPIVASMGGNAGTQTLAVTVRALATRELSLTNAWRVINKETLVGFINGIAFAVVGGALAWWWFDDMMIGAVISGAMIINLVIAGLFGVLIPLVLDRLKIDPALASSVFLTTITDVVGFVVFLGLATIFLI